MVLFNYLEGLKSNKATNGVLSMLKTFFDKMNNGMLWVLVIPIAILISALATLSFDVVKQIKTHQLSSFL